MKKLYIYIMALGIAATASSCSDSFLDTEPITTITDANFYKTVEDADLALVGCYDGVQQIYANGVAFPVASEVMSDNCFGATGNNDALGYQVMDELDLSRSPGEVNLLDATWAAYYKAIYRVNVLLQKMDQIDWTGQEDYRNVVEAQARFLRAYSYFDMVRLWERVPLVTEPTDENVPQSEPDAIYAQITEDLLYAAEFGSETVEAGRINKWVAKAYLARVYMFYTGYYGAADLVGQATKAEVLQGLEDVISEGAYELVADYKNLWPAASSTINTAGDGLETTYAGKDNSETIFAIKYNITSDYDGNVDGNQWLVMLGLRSQSFSPYGKGWGACTVLPSLYNAYEAGDTRREASIIGINEEALDFDNSDQREYTGYTNKKYTPLANPDGQDVSEANGSTNFQIGQYQDFVVMRYADVLLMAAELGSGSAQSYFDQVRTRSGLASKPATVTNILEERRLEFAFEGIRYWDLLRQGVDAAASKLAFSGTVENGGVATPKTIAATNVQTTRGLLMIPQNQITRSAGVLTQNEGWK
ncbi:Starch-binding associating with outer membrane [Reichenbachiella agariperforans]|uniref:Starch-binding associating with outer membrane n=1 Tax=Reichenbachiella agariperforans TaxID=156994 RepID=A0A1M6UY45_REIAG|nr:RagB/SusD family nutrient uptake outer membrane protein [Reichenbachiella agariperforans]SHK74015.1 Starch-binding associating with outer membrane [Reichenbachiella agariperforans]